MHREYSKRFRDDQQSNLWAVSRFFHGAARSAGRKYFGRSGEGYPTPDSCDQAQPALPGVESGASARAVRDIAYQAATPKNLLSEALSVVGRTQQYGLESVL